MVFTAVLAAIAVIAAMVAVPGARAAEPTDFKPNFDLGSEAGKGGADESWGDLVWAGAPAHHAGGTDVSQGNPKNNVGWGWCIDTLVNRPMQTMQLYDKETAGKAPIPAEYHDAAIGIALKLREATDRGDKAAAANYSVYLTALLAHPASKPAAAMTITGQSASYGGVLGLPHYPKFTGSHEEFKRLTGFEIVDAEKGVYKRDPDVVIKKQPADAFITIVGPDGNLNGKPFGQRVVPIDQPGLPGDDGGNPGEEGEETPSNPTTTPPEDTETVTTSPATETTSDETPATETTSDETPSSSTTDETDEPTTTPDTEVIPEPTPSTEQKEEPRKPSIKTEAKFGGESEQVVAGATVVDTVRYEDLVPGKKYTLKAELRSKVAD